MIPRKVHADEPQARNLKVLLNGNERERVVFADVDEGYVLVYAHASDFTEEQKKTLLLFSIAPMGDGGFMLGPCGVIPQIRIDGAVQIIRADEDDGN
jgi:hypothetical protein